MTEPGAGSTLQTTPLHDLHVTIGAKMAPFAGYDMPIRYREGTIAEHLHTRGEVSLFDVSHMGVIEVRGDRRAEEFERLVPSAITTLGEHRLRYTFLTNESGGIIDDLIVRNDPDRLVLIVNAARKADDLAHLDRELRNGVEAVLRPDMAILALQGPRSAEVLSEMAPEVAELGFMTGAAVTFDDTPLRVSRSGYTGEDGFELLVAAGAAVPVAHQLLEHRAVKPAGLGARDTLRLEAGLCLYGQDLDENTTPVEAGLVWAMQKRRRTHGGFIGYTEIRSQLDTGPSRLRVGIRPDGRAPVRAGDPLHNLAGTRVGDITSGTFGPTIGGPVAMGYVDINAAQQGTKVIAQVRGKEVACSVVALPFVPHRYVRGVRQT